MPYTSVKPISVVQSSPRVSEEGANAVGSTPSMAQGCRPTSAMTQPSSVETQGSGMAATASSRNHRWSKRRRLHSRKARLNSPMKKKPSPAITRKLQNISGTFGTVSQAASSICCGVARRGSPTVDFSSRA